MGSLGPAALLHPSFPPVPRLGCIGGQRRLLTTCTKAQGKPEYAPRTVTYRVALTKKQSQLRDRGAARRGHGKVERGHRWGSTKAERGHRRSAGKRSAGSVRIKREVLTKLWTHCEDEVRMQSIWTSTVSTASQINQYSSSALSLFIN